MSAGSLPRDAEVADGVAAGESGGSALPPPRSRARVIGTIALDLGLLAGFWLLFFWSILVRRTHLIPYDLIDQHYMFQEFIHRALRTGQAPWWTPNIMGGYPIAADPLSAIFYPPNLLMHSLVRGDFLPYLALEWQATLHFLWAAFGAYFLARSMTGSRAGALLAALTFAFGSFFALHIPHLSPVSSLSWVPWILLAYRRAVLDRSLAWTGAGALAVGMMALAGHAFTIVEVGYLIVALTLFLAWRHRKAGRRAVLQTLAIGGTVLALGAALAMVQMLPSWQLGSATERAQLPYQDATGSSLAPNWALTAVLPNFFSLRGPATYWSSGDPAESNLYAGLLPLFLAGLGVVRARGDDRRTTLLLLGGALAAVALALGSHAWAYRLAFDMLPMVDRVRRPIDSLALIQLTLGLLAAYGMKALTEADERGRTAGRTLAGWLRWALLADLVALGFAALALAGVSGTPRQQVLIAVADGIVLAGVILLASLVVVRARVEWIASVRVAAALLVLITALDLGSALRGAVTDNFQRAPDAYIGADWAGSSTDTAVAFLQGGIASLAPDQARILPEGAGSIWSNGPLVWNLQSAYGYSVLWPARYNALFGAATQNLSSPLFDILNIRYVITNDAIEKVVPSASPQKFRLVRDGSPRIYEDPTAMPRVWVASRTVYQPDSTALAWMQRNAAALRETAVVNEPPTTSAPGSAGAPGSASIVRYENGRVDIHASMSAPGLVVLADTYYPGWQATIDGVPAHVYQADYAFRAVWVPAGEHEIEYRFTLPLLGVGATITTLAAILIAALVAGGFALSRRRTVVTDRSS